MIKGKSYLTYTDKSNHPIISALKKKGFYNMTLIYASHWSTNSGWDLVDWMNDKKVEADFSGWLGYTKKEALIKISEL